VTQQHKSGTVLTWCNTLAGPFTIKLMQIFNENCEELEAAGLIKLAPPNT